MARIRRAIALLLTSGLLGCTAKTVPLALPGTTLQPAAVGDGGPPAEVSVASASRMGTLSLVIRWPQVPAGYRAQFIPSETNALAVWVKQGTSDVSQPIVVTRLPGALTASASLSIEAANNLSVVVKGYRETSPDLASATAICQGTAAGVNVVPSRSTNVALTMASLLVPTITAMSSNAGLAGDALTLTGTDFGAGSDPVPGVTFNGTAAPSVTRNSTTSLTVTVPAGVTTGNVVVQGSGGVSSSTATFWVPESLQILSGKAAWDPTPVTNRLVMFGHTLQFTPSPTWALKSGDSAANYGTAPSPVWSSTNPSAGSVSASGLFTAANTYQSTSIGAAIASVSSAVQPVQLVANTPVVTGISPGYGGPAGNGQPGSIVTVNGSGFGNGPNSTLAVTLGGLPVNNLTMLGDTQLTFQIPASAVNSKVQVTSYGVAAAASPSLQVLSSLTTSPSGSNTYHLGGTQQFTVSGKDSAGVNVASPTVTWLTDGSGAATVSASGLVTMTDIGTASVVAQIGGLSSPVCSLNVDYTYDLNTANVSLQQLWTISASSNTSTVFYDQPFKPNVTSLKAVDVPCPPIDSGGKYLNSLYMEVRADDGTGVPVSTPLVSGNATYMSAIAGKHVFKLPSAATLTAGQTYHLIFKLPAGTGYGFTTYATAVDSFGLCHSSSDGLTWSTGTSLLFSVNGTPHGAQELYFRTGY